MTLRERQIEQVANLILFGVLYDAQTLDEVKQINEGGWTVDVNMDDGWWLHCEDVVLTDAELAQAWAMAQEWVG